MDQVADAGNQWVAVLLFMAWWALLGLFEIMFPDADSGKTKPPVDAARGASPKPAASAPPACGAVVRADPSFDEQDFLDGAACAYETILHAYASGDMATLRHLLAPEVLSAFEAAIGERRRGGLEMAIAFIGLKEARVIEAGMAGSVAEIDVRFVAQLVSTVRTAGGELVQGDPERIVETGDVWTFSRDVSQGRQQWRLVATDEDAAREAIS